MENIPIHVSPQDLKENPEFALLLADLGENHLVNGISRHLADSLNKTKMGLDRAKFEYFKALLLHTEVANLLFESSADPAKKYYEIAQRALETAETARALPSLGVDEEILQEFNLGVPKEKLPEQMGAVSQELCRELTDRLAKKCVSLVDFYEPQPHNTQVGDLQVAKGIQLAELVASKIAKLEGDQRALGVESVNNTLSFWEYYYVLEKLLLALGTIITTHKNQHAHQESTVAAKWLHERLQTTQVKLQLLEKQFISATYTKESNKSLKVIGESLGSAMTQAKHAHERAVVRLQQYDAIGLGFSTLAQEYSVLVKECAHKEWALQELGKE